MVEAGAGAPAPAEPSPRRPQGTCAVGEKAASAGMIAAPGGLALAISTRKE